jgi:hypothetical protein
VEDGKFITAGGVSAGIDMAIALAARSPNRATAQRLQLGVNTIPTRRGHRLERGGEKELTRQRQVAPAATGGAPRLLPAGPICSSGSLADPEKEAIVKYSTAGGLCTPWRA